LKYDSCITKSFLIWPLKGTKGNIIQKLIN